MGERLERWRYDRAEKQRERRRAAEANRLAAEKKWVAKRSDIISKIEDGGHSPAFTTSWAANVEAPGGGYTTKMYCKRCGAVYRGGRRRGLTPKRSCEVLVADLGPEVLVADLGPPEVQEERRRTPSGGLRVRSVPNRNADPTGHIEGGLVVRVIERSGIWVRIQTTEENPVWVESGALEPTEDP